MWHRGFRLLFPKNMMCIERKSESKRLFDGFFPAFNVKNKRNFLDYIELLICSKKAKIIVSTHSKANVALEKGTYTYTYPGKRISVIVFQSSCQWSDTWYPESLKLPNIENSTPQSWSPTCPTKQIYYSSETLKFSGLDIDSTRNKRIMWWSWPSNAK